jgi:hypothetical protein
MMTRAFYASQLANRERLVASFKSRIDAFFVQHHPEDTTLILDSTGPSATRHYLFLRALGMDRLHRMKAVYGFSGGAFAYLGFHAVHGDALAMPIEHFYRRFDKIFRQCHHPEWFSPAKALTRLGLQKGSPFKPVALERVLLGIFSEDFLNQPLHTLRTNFVPIVGVKGQDAVKNARELMSPEAAYRDLLMSVCRVPAFYGRPDASSPLFDAAFAKGYKKSLKELTRDSGGPVLVSTPWRDGDKGGTRYINCFGHNQQKLAMLRDFTLLMLNLPNKGYQQDLEVAFSG